MFKPFEISLHRVHDRVKITEGAESLTLMVEADPMRLVAGLTQAQNVLKGISEKSSEEDQKTAALFFAEVIFGKLQAMQLLEFYRNDSSCVIYVCGKYFAQRLSQLIIKAQKK